MRKLSNTILTTAIIFTSACGSLITSTGIKERQKMEEIEKKNDEDAQPKAEVEPKIDTSVEEKAPVVEETKPVLPAPTGLTAPLDSDKFCYITIKNSIEVDLFIEPQPITLQPGNKLIAARIRSTEVSGYYEKSDGKLLVVDIPLTENAVDLDCSNENASSVRGVLKDTKIYKEQELTTVLCQAKKGQLHKESGGFWFSTGVYQGFQLDGVMCNEQLQLFTPGLAVGRILIKNQYLETLGLNNSFIY